MCIFSTAKVGGYWVHCWNSRLCNVECSQSLILHRGICSTISDAFQFHSVWGFCCEGHDKCLQWPPPATAAPLATTLSPRWILDVYRRGIAGYDLSRGGSREAGLLRWLPLFSLPFKEAAREQERETEASRE